MLKNLIDKIARTRFVYNAIAEGANLDAFKQRPSLRSVIGMTAIALSYVIGWPLIAVLGVLSIYLHRPLLIAIGGPTAYLLSHLVFWLGMYLAGMRYSFIFLRWLTRITMTRLMKMVDLPLPPDPSLR